MFGVGAPEFLIILLIAVLLFGPAILTFWLGYVVGSKKAGQGRYEEPGASAAQGKPDEMPSPPEAGEEDEAESDV